MEISRLVNLVLNRLQKRRYLGKSLFGVICSKSELRHIKRVDAVYGRVCIYCDSPAVLYEFNLKKEAFLKIIQDNISTEINDVVFKIGR